MSKQEDSFKIGDINLKPVLNWILINTGLCPVDCYIRLKGSSDFILFQKRGSATRKELLKALLKKGVFEFYSPDSQFQQYVALVEQVFESNLGNEIFNQFKTQQQLYNLFVPPGARLPYHVQKALTEMGVLSPNFNREDFNIPEYASDADILKMLFSDINLTAASIDKEADQTLKKEIEDLNKKNRILVDQNKHLSEEADAKEAELSTLEIDLKKGRDEFSKSQAELGKIQSDFDEYKRKTERYKTELDGLLAGQLDAKKIYADRLVSMEKRVEEIRAESQDFKLKYAREVDKSKELQRNLSQAQLNLNRALIALQKLKDQKE